MSLPNTLNAYRDCRDLFEAAAVDPKGARALIGEYGDAVNMRMRMNYFRNLDRMANASTYPQGHPLHGTSAYDPFVCKVMRDEDNAFWVYVVPRTSQIKVIEGLSSVGDLIDVEGEEVGLIEDKTNG